MERINKPSYTPTFLLGDRVIVKHDTTGGTYTIRGIYIEEKTCQYFISDFKTSGCAHENDLELVLGPAVE